MYLCAYSDINRTSHVTELHTVCNHSQWTVYLDTDYVGQNQSMNEYD